MEDGHTFVKVFDPAAEYRPYAQEIRDAVIAVLDSGNYVLGEQVNRFEEELARYLGVRYVIGVASGTDALIISLRACGIRPGDEVITTPFSFIATASAILHVGARPVFADISLHDYNIDPDSVLECLSDRARAVLPVHLFGHPAPMEDLKALAEAHGLMIIEDVAQGLGAEIKGMKAGSIGTAAAFSFYPTKTLGGFGDGGAIATNDEEIARRARMLRDHGKEGTSGHLFLGYNSRLDEIQAAALRVKLRHLDEMVEKRRAIARAYSSLLADGDVLPPDESEDVRHAFGLYTVRCRQRDRLAEFLRSRRVGCGIYYSRPIFKHPLFRSHPYSAAKVKNTLVACREALSLPMHSGLSPEDIQHVLDVLHDWIGEIRIK